MTDFALFGRKKKIMRGRVEAPGQEFMFRGRREGMRKRGRNGGRERGNERLWERTRG